jgi:hypothetical protein
MRYGRPIADRFWEKVDVRGPTECWPWLAAGGRAGCGRLRIGNNRWGRLVNAPRVAWFISRGEWPPENKHVCHRCDNPPCCNPAHLWLGTNSDNQRDCVTKGRKPRRYRKNRSTLLV